MYYLFLSLTILTIISQTIHTYAIFESYSRLKGNLKAVQAIIFCGIISVSIMAFVLIGNKQLALLGAFIEICINILYYGSAFWENGFPTRKNRFASILGYWRKSWGMYFFGVIIPMLIYVFADQMIKLR